jgi:hypothetical protein
MARVLKTHTTGGGGTMPFFQRGMDIEKLIIYIVFLHTKLTHRFISLRVMAPVP